MKPNPKFYPNSEIAEYLTNVATAYEIKNKNYFRIVSYQNAADIIQNYPKSVYEIWQQDKKLLDDIPGIGATILGKLDYLFSNGKYHPGHVLAFADIHPAVFVLTKVNGIGPKIAYKLTTQLKFPQKNPLKIFGRLIKYAKSGKIKDLESFGQKSEDSILQNTLSYLGRQNRMDLKTAQKIAADLISYLKIKFPQVEFIPLGSLRRLSPSVGDIDIAAKSDQAQDIINYFVNYPLNIQTISQGPKKASIKINHDIRLDLMVQSQKSFGSLLQHFTGSKIHNIKLRRYAETLGLSLSEYGIKDLKTGHLHTFDTEKEFYKFLKLNYIEPQNRVGESEIETAKMI
jgi:DNA polymerase (family X)